MKGLLQYERMKENTVAIGVDQSLSNSAIYEDICFKNSNKLYKYEGKRDN